MQHNLNRPIDSRSTVPKDLRNFPFVQATYPMSETLEVIGVIAATNVGMGDKGHIAYNQPPLSSWYRY